MSLEAGHVNFVTLGHPRCGSNLLLRALIEHPEIRMMGELLAPEERIRHIAWTQISPSAWTHPRGENYRVGEDGAEFLARSIFGNEAPPRIRSSGFKLFYDHGRFDPSVATAWDYLIANDIRIVHLVRRNLLYALLSLEVAQRTNQWSLRVAESSGPRPPLPPFALSPVACRQYFDHISGQYAWARQAFAKHKLLTVEYEQGLWADFDGTVAKVFEFLGASARPSQPALRKQQGVSAAQQLTNFEQLRKHFSDTPYAEFFEDAHMPVVSGKW